MIYLDGRRDPTAGGLKHGRSWDENCGFVQGDVLEAGDNLQPGKTG